ncbi:MAG: hypothetical protein JO272_17435 [Pseudonocardiales bacterium]|nr:hypothetical protein [Pseudonocardiales bacterium]
MADRSVGSELDLDAILATRWADPAVFPASEFLRASEFYCQRRNRDEELLAVRAKTAALIREWTGRDSRDVGSFGLRLNLETSDLDLGIGYPVERREELIALLAPKTVFKGERVTRFPAADFRSSEPAATTRLVFAFEVDGVEVDLSALTEEDFAVACRMLDDIEASMTEPERIAHTWVKYLLRSSGRMAEYAQWKLVTYARFCPEFTWVPIPEPS